MGNTVTTTQSTAPSQQQHRELSEMGMGPVGAAQPSGCVTGISLPGSRKSHVVAGILSGFCPPGWHWHCPQKTPTPTPSQLAAGPLCSPALLRPRRQATSPPGEAGGPQCRHGGHLLAARSCGHVLGTQKCQLIPPR